MVTDLKDAGFSPNEVCAVTGHKDERSLQPYDRLDRAGCDRPRADVLDGKPGGVKRRMNDSPNSALHRNAHAETSLTRSYRVTRPSSTASPSTSAPRQLNRTSSLRRALQVLNPELISLKSCRTLFVSFVSFLML